MRGRCVEDYSLVLLRVRRTPPIPNHKRACENGHSQIYKKIQILRIAKDHLNKSPTVQFRGAALRPTHVGRQVWSLACPNTMAECASRFEGWREQMEKTIERGKENREAEKERKGGKGRGRKRERKEEECVRENEACSRKSGIGSKKSSFFWEVVDKIVVKVINEGWFIGKKIILNLWISFKTLYLFLSSSK